VDTGRIPVAAASEQKPYVKFEYTVYGFGGCFLLTVTSPKFIVRFVARSLLRDPRPTRRAARYRW
jgi:hypothetical protein